MEGKIIIAPNYEDVEGPLIFLAGPIQGAPYWQKDAARLIHEYDPAIHIASPRRDVASKGDFTEAMYNEQVDWETHYLRRAANQGSILFWLAKEDEHFCDRAYAQTTRFELAEWKAMSQSTTTRIVVGIQNGFTGSRYIVRRLSQDCPRIPICSSLEETCRKAIDETKKE